MSANRLNIESLGALPDKYALFENLQNITHYVIWTRIQVVAQQGEHVARNFNNLTSNPLRDGLQIDNQFMILGICSSPHRSLIGSGWNSATRYFEY